MQWYDKYIKYKTKYYQLKQTIKKDQAGGTHNCSLCTGDHCMKTIDCLIAQINQIPEDAIQIEKIIPGANTTKKSVLVVIPGFSNSAYIRNCSALFEYYPEKLDPDNFKQTILIKFKDSEDFSISKLNNSFFYAPKKILDPLLENKLYQKCGEIISIKLGNMFDSNTKYTILGKSAGGGVSICLSEIIYKQIHKMFLFAPGVEYLPMSINKLKLDESKITVGWNIEDTKVPIDRIWPELSKLLPNTTIIKFNMDVYFNTKTGEPEDTQHEINSQFIQYVKE
jgi:hypothetical protein